MSDAVADAFWSRFVTRAGPAPRGPAPSVGAAARGRDAASDLPPSLVALLARGPVARVDAPGFAVGPVGDWLEHALARRAAMRALADAHGNPVLAWMVPFGDTAHGFEVAADLRAPGGRVVWLDPSRYDAGADAVVAVVAESVEGYVRAQLAERADVAAR